MDGPDERDASRGDDRVFGEIWGIVTDAAVVVCLVTTIYLIEALSHWLMPPEGPVFFRHTRFEFPFQWMVDAMHLATFATFMFRVVRRMWR